MIDQNKFGIYFELTLSILFMYALELKHENEEDGEVQHEAEVDADLCKDIVEDEAGDEDEEDAEDGEDGEDEEDDNKKIGDNVRFIIDSKQRKLDFITN